MGSDHGFPGTDATKEQIAFAQSIGADSVFPFSGLNKPQSAWETWKDAHGTANAARDTMTKALTAAAADPGPITIYHFSGGAQITKSTLASVPPELASRVTTVVNVDPGGIGALPSGSQTTVTVTGTAAKDSLATALSIPTSQTAFTVNCDKHEANCVFGAARQILPQYKSDPCSHQ
ncbi:MAG TPA: hypothetical protein VE998_01340, partial [Terriglobales bacterium]|nr:hypothetical protein [Terriglobales bacterium]